jgi:ureidoglycolate dehydrogenase (NAD+)
MIAIVMSNTPKNMTAPGTCGNTCGNNPLAYSAPCAGRHPIFMDIGMSAVNGTKIKRAVDSGAKTLPAGWVVDENGRPTTDAAHVPYFMAPMAGHKGFCLSMLVDILSAVLSGGGLMYETKLWRTEDAVPNTSHAIILLNPAEIIGLNNFENRMKQTADDYLASQKAVGTDRIYLPGDKEWEHYDRAVSSGLELPDDIADQMLELAEVTGVSFEDCVLSCDK